MNSISYTLRRRVAVLRWMLPISFALMAALYQWGFARWVHDTYGDLAHFGVEILFYSTVGPLLAFLILTLIGRWLDDKERAEKQARATERRLASITAASADAILSLASSGRIESWNRGAELLFGYSENEIRDRPFTALFGGGESAEVEFNWLVETVRQAGFVRGHETICRNAQGEEISADLTATQLSDDIGQPPGMSIILRDVTQRKRREEEIRRLNANLNEQVAERTRELAEKVEQLARANADLQNLDRLKSEFVSLVSHELRAPLTNVRGAVELMESGCPTLNPTCARMFKIVSEQIGRLGRMVDEVLDVSRIEAGGLTLAREAVDVMWVTDRVVDEFTARYVRRRFRRPSGVEHLQLWADTDRLHEVVANLMDNAVKYSPEDGEVAIRVDIREKEGVISVSDDGPGIPVEEQNRIFEKFHRLDAGDSKETYGYGLGLYLSRHLIEAMGGRIWVESAPGHGATFRFALPLAE